MGIRSTYHQILVRACVIAGDEAELAKRLRVPIAALVSWLLNDERIPPEIFLRAADIIAAEREYRIAQRAQHVEDVNAFLEEIKRKYRS